MYGTYGMESQGLLGRTLWKTFKRSTVSQPDPAVVGAAMVYDDSDDAQGEATTIVVLDGSSVQERASKAWQQLHGAAVRLLEPLAQYRFRPLSANRAT